MVASRPSCWSQPFALRTGHELLRARHLTLSAMQQIAPLFDTQCPVLLTDISVLNTSRSSPDSDISALDVSRRPVRELLRIRHLAHFADRGLLRTLHLAPCVELVSLHPQHLSPGTKLGLLLALCLAPCAEDELFRAQLFSSPHRTRIATCSMLCARPARELLRVRHLALFALHGLLHALQFAPYAAHGLLRVQPFSPLRRIRIATHSTFCAAPNADYSTFDTWLSMQLTNCSVLCISFPALNSDCFKSCIVRSISSSDCSVPDT